MSRYTNVDALKQQVESPYTEYPIMIQIRKALKDFIDEAPSIDIVRCKECKWYDTDVWTTRCWCGRVSSVGNCKYVKPDDFCSYGERI